MPKTFGSIYRKCVKYTPCKDISGENEVLTSVSCDFEGRQVSSSKYVIDKPRERYAGYKPSQFALENQLAVGVQLRPVFCSLQRNEIDSRITSANNLKVENHGDQDN